MDSSIKDTINITSTSDKTQNEVNVHFNYTVKFELNENSDLSDLRSLINKEFMMKDDEYDIFIKDLQLLIINQDIKIASLIQNYQTNEFIVKSYKSIK
jgi:hypothetical protein